MERDPVAQKVTVLEWVDGLYEEQVFQGNQAIASSQLADLTLTAAVTLVTGRQMNLTVCCGFKRIIETSSASLASVTVVSAFGPLM